MSPSRVLVVDDDALFRMSLCDFFAGKGIDARNAASVDEARGLGVDEYDVIIVDRHLPDGEGLTLLEYKTAHLNSPSFVVVTGDPGVEHAMAAVRSGQVADYLSKPVDLVRLERVVDRALEQRRRAQMVSEPTGALSELQMERYATSDVPLLLCGETGTGKTLLASRLHAKSRRASQPFVALNCASLAESVVEVELFGSTRGAFTGATDRPGMLEIAHKGTLFLDEIGELSPAVQAKLLTVLEDGVVRRVGGRTTATVDVRLICATHVDLEAAVSAGRFRADLLHRIDVGRLHVLPLRKRLGELEPLIAVMLDAIGAPSGARLAAGERERLGRHSWPGNLRELRNLLSRAVLLHPHDDLRPSELLPSEAVAPPPRLAPEALPEERPHRIAASKPAAVASLRPLEDVIQQHIEATLAACGGNRAQAARHLGISIATLRRRLNQGSSADE